MNKQNRMPGQVEIKGATFRTLEGNPDFELPTYSPGQTQEDIDTLVGKGALEEKWAQLTFPLGIGESFIGRLLKLGKTKDDNSYAVFQGVDENLKDLGPESRFRSWAPGQMRYRLTEQAAIGDVVRVEYLGKSDKHIEVDGQKVFPHQVKVDIVTITH